MKTILIGEISSYKAIVCARFLEENYDGDIQILTFDYRSFTAYFHSKYTQGHHIVSNPNLSSEAYILDIKQIIERYNVDLFFPVNSKFLSILLENRDKFGLTLSYFGSNSNYNILNNKNHLQMFLDMQNIRIMPRHFDSIENATMPFVFKPEAKSSSAGIVYFFSHMDYINKAKNIVEKGVFQEYIAGIGIGFSCFCRNGEIVDSYAHKRLVEYPISGGSSLYRAPYKDSRLMNIVSEIVKATNWSGFAMFEFKLTPDNELFLIEVNPRIWGSINQGLVNGINYFEALLGPVNISREPTPKPKFTYLPPLIYFAFIRLVLRGKCKPLFNFISNHQSNVSDVSILKDFGGYLSLILRKIL